MVNDLNLAKSVEFLGRIQKNEVVNVLKKANIYCQSSNYETFSAVCIEALATGTPVLATNIGGMKDFVNKNNGILVNSLEVEDWVIALEKGYLNYEKFNKQDLSNDCIAIYNSKSVGKLYYSELMRVLIEK